MVEKREGRAFQRSMNQALVEENKKLTEEIEHLRKIEAEDIAGSLRRNGGMDVALYRSVTILAKNIANNKNGDRAMKMVIDLLNAENLPLPAALKNWKYPVRKRAKRKKSKGAGA